MHDPDTNPLNIFKSRIYWLNVDSYVWFGKNRKSRNFFAATDHNLGYFYVILVVYKHKKIPEFFLKWLIVKMWFRKI
jgi:hypothetical protein